MIKPEEQNGSVSLEQAQDMLADLSAVNLDEVSPEVVKVAFREFKPVALGRGYTVETTIKEINTWVPMFLFNRMLANQKQVQKLRKLRARAEEAREKLLDEIADVSDVHFLIDDGEEEDLFQSLTDEMFKEILTNSEPAIIWQAREVLTVWKLTPGEGEMSLKRLLLGLTFEQIQGLFMRFFGAMLQKRTSKA